jgi:TRAP-type mannitol/chloroaromatic compound transport system permease small subunit
MDFITRPIDFLNEKTGYYSSFLILPLIGVVGFEVMMRYFFNKPTVWAFELTTYIYGIHFILAFGYAHKHNSHVAIDIFESRLPERPRTILRICANLVIFLPTIGMLALWSVFYAQTAWDIKELSWSSWAPPLYPFKAIMAVGLILFFLQGVSKLLHDIRSLRRSA